MADVRLERISKAYGNVQILHDIDLDIAHGEFAVFVGPSGSGKSTLLRMIGGLESISEGQLLIDNNVVNDVDASDRNLGMVFQSYALYPHMTVRQNLAFPLRMAKASAGVTEAKVRQAAALLQVEHLLDRKPRQLSGGQRQRVAIGRAIVREPKVFLFDEPLSNLDTELRVQMRVQIAKLHRQLGNTMIYVTHDQVEAMTMADKIVVLKDGRIEQVGTPHDLYHRPASQFVAGFIGSPKMNFIDATLVAVHRERAEIRLETGMTVSLPIDASAQAVGEPVTLGIRPDDFRSPADSEQGLIVELEVDFVEHLGNATYFYGNVGAASLVARAPKLEAAGRLEKIALAATSADCHLFLPNGKALRRLHAPTSWN
ncbi:sn-glycerol-3-phosphate ABC transporter ATP-binding protein UgpC [Mesorhizobium sp.]|uniref:ABC transporter ATP-binding protein n=1 Tax=Mesorhizobium sp. TaxID=1871066 RepID=UPI000FE506C5|nr:sn-glycerol-3-phosphate ABC transporter ATP-binding protein UgpC [Mesorhizobium sp.]RWI16595.1 MAG: sn-glycerol-3-phosphate ABC transporter ATP-binding protein UgpC [Mesorhizobium sp.]RWN07663.1 MAG: sn-glycerol-3-phosphate ABC transporter ATP-binding protein UgpC [Mesorhizobium sp.]RWN12418.1 MAG: sn-glycerol-3-phosphate ABC transporter ATP-binding protein UgpC [Mesorhizobium sp.]TIQ97709.1 MAG: sn-glycerol-3-phosphate ABC transporter ATP-binding protein UgpC [Mesorhizobium sp.]